MHNESKTEKTFTTELRFGVMLLLQMGQEALAVRGHRVCKMDLRLLHVYRLDVWKEGVVEIVHRLIETEHALHISFVAQLQYVVIGRIRNGNIGTHLLQALFYAIQNSRNECPEDAVVVGIAAPVHLNHIFKACREVLSMNITHRYVQTSQSPVQHRATLSRYRLR